MNLTICDKICPQCPFRKTALKGWLGPHSIEEILHVQQMEGLFTCHMRRKEKSTDADIHEGRLPICRGFVASASASCKRFGQHPLTGRHLAKLQETITKEEKELVLTRWDFDKHHRI